MAEIEDEEYEYQPPASTISTSDSEYDYDLPEKPRASAIKPLFAGRAVGDEEPLAPMTARDYLLSPKPRPAPTPMISSHSTVETKDYTYEPPRTVASHAQMQLPEHTVGPARFIPPSPKGPRFGAAPSESVQPGVPLYAGHPEGYTPETEGQPNLEAGQAYQKVLAAAAGEQLPEGAGDVTTDLPTGSVRPNVPLYAGANQHPETTGGNPQTLEEGARRMFETPLPTGPIKPGVPLYGGAGKAETVNQNPAVTPGGAAGIGAGVAQGAAALGDTLGSPEALGLLVGIPAVSSLLPARAAAILNAAATGKFGFDIAHGLSTERSAQLGDAIGSKDPKKIATALTAMAGDLAFLVHPKKTEGGIGLGGMIPEGLEQGKAALEAAGVKPKPQFETTVERATGLEPQAAAVQEVASKELERDPRGYVDKYREKFGKVVNADNAKELLPGFSRQSAAPADRLKNSGAVHEPSAHLAKLVYADMLSEEAAPTEENLVVFTAGGAGAGKTTALSNVPRARRAMDSAQIVYDGVMGNFASAKAKIDQALLAGKNVEYFYTHRDLVDAYDGVLARASSEDRMVAVDPHVEGHFGANETFQKLREHYTDNRRVSFLAVDNSGDFGKAKPLDVDSVPAVSYDREEAKDALRKKAARARNLPPGAFEAAVPSPAHREGAQRSIAAQGRQLVGEPREEGPAGDGGEPQPGSDEAPGPEAVAAAVAPPSAPEPEKIEARADELERQFQEENHAKRGPLLEQARLRQEPPTREEFEEAARQEAENEKRAVRGEHPDEGPREAAGLGREANQEHGETGNAGERIPEHEPAPEVAGAAERPAGGRAERSAEVPAGELTPPGTDFPADPMARGFRILDEKKSRLRAVQAQTLRDAGFSIAKASQIAKLWRERPQAEPEPEAPKPAKGRVGEVPQKGDTVEWDSNGRPAKGTVVNVDAEGYAHVDTHNGDELHGVPLEKLKVAAPEAESKTPLLSRALAEKKDPIKAAVAKAIKTAAQDRWTEHPIKMRLVANAAAKTLGTGLDRSALARAVDDAARAKDAREAAGADTGAANAAVVNSYVEGKASKRRGWADAALEKAGLPKLDVARDAEAWRQVDAKRELTPETHEVGAAPEAIPGPRWEQNRGAMPGEPIATLDGGPEDGKAAIMEVPAEGAAGRATYEARTGDGNLIGTFTGSDTAAKAAEEWADNQGESHASHEQAGSVRPYGEEPVAEGRPEAVREPESEREAAGAPPPGAGGREGHGGEPRPQGDESERGAGAGGEEPPEVRSGERAGEAAALGEGRGEEHGGSGDGEPREEHAAVTKEAEGTSLDPVEEGLVQAARGKSGRDFRFSSAAEAETDLAGGSARHLASNFEAIRLLKAIEREGRPATAEEQKLLAKYIGWGQFPEVFNPWASGKDRARQEELKDLIGEESYDAAKASTKNAHYTSPQIVAGMWDMVKRLGFKGGRVLEPALGSGNFFALMPPELKGKSRLTGIELDETTGGIAKLLYPQQNIQVKGFEKHEIPDGFYDLAISNVPFGDYRVHDKPYNKYRANIHDYFFLRSLDKVRPGGAVAFITSTGTLDKIDPGIREAMIEKGADLVAAIRLPGETFKKNAGTSVVTDIVIMRKRLPGEEPSGHAWTKTVEVPDPRGGKPIPVNEYFASHPEQMLGTLERTGSMYGGEEKNVTRTDDFEERFGKAVEGIPKNVIKPRATPKAFEPKVVATENDPSKVGGFAVRGKKLYVRTGDIMVEQKAAPAEIARIGKMLDVRDGLRKVFNAQLSGEGEAAAEAARGELNQKYDDFVKEHGPILSKQNARLMASDPDFPVLAALEKYDPKTGTSSKTDVFTKNTLRSYTRPEKAANAGEALGISLKENGNVNAERMAQLLGMSEADLGKRLVKEGLAYEDPGAGWQPSDLYLSGNVRQKLAAAQEAAHADARYRPNVEALKGVQPDDVDFTDIDARVGAPWIPAPDMVEFMKSLVGGRDEDFYSHFSPHDGSWMLRFTGSGERRLFGTEPVTKIWGTSRVPFPEIIEAAASGRPVIVRDRSGEESVVNPEESAAANQKVEDVKQAFKDWVWEEQDRRTRLHRIYNDNFNNLRPISYSSEHYKDEQGKYVLPGMNPALPMRKPQSDFAWRIVTTGKGLAAHEVGVGKTNAMVAAAMELRRLGLARKPIIAVPNAVIDGFLTRARKLYPAARILATGESFDAAHRKETIARIATGDWDMVLMTHDNLDMLPMRPEVVQGFVKEEIQELESALLDAKEERSNRVVKQLEKAKSKLEARLEEAIEGSKKDNAVFFEELGGDMLFVDEAHKYKSLPVYTARQGIKGIPTSRSDRATNMLMRTRWLQEQNNGRGVVFATGTPIANTMVELYNLQRYLQPKELKERGIQSFDAWMNTFADTVTKMEYSAAGKFQPTTRLARFSNLPELQQLARQVIDVQRANSVEGLVRPKRHDEVITSDMSAFQEEYLKTIQRRVEKLKTMSPQERKDSGENMLVISTDARKSAMDHRLVDPHAPDHPGSKVNKCVETVLKIHRENPEKTQAIFSDFGVHAGKDGRISIYQDITKKLVKGGIPRDKIIDFSDLTDRAKQGAIERLNSGDALVGIGSTDKLGTGVNIQKKLVAVHHLDVPWLPAAIEQRDGRAWRQNNENKDIRVVRYSTKGSFDTFMWQAVDSKSKFIRQFIDGDLKARALNEPDGEELTPAQVMAITSGSPELLEKVQLDQDISNLERAGKRHQKVQAELRDSVGASAKRAEVMQQRIDRLEAARGLAEKRGKFSATVNGRTYDEPEAAGQAMLPAITKAREEMSRYGNTDPATIATYRGEPIKITGRGNGIVPNILDGHLELTLNAEKPESVFQSFDSTTRFLPKYVEEGKAQREAVLEGAKRAKAEIGKGFKGAEDLVAKRLRSKEIEQILKKRSEEKPAPEVVGTTTETQRERERFETEEKGDPQPHVDALKKNTEAYLAGRISQEEFDKSNRALWDAVPKELGDAVSKALTNESTSLPVTATHDFVAAPPHDLSANPKPQEEEPEPPRPRAVPKEPPSGRMPKEPKVAALPFAPEKLARLGKIELRSTLGELARRHDVEATAMDAWDRHFDVPGRRAIPAGHELEGIAKEWEDSGRKDDAKALRDHAEQVDFIDRMENGRTQSTLASEGLARYLKKAFDGRKDELIGLGMDAAKDWMENYFPHIWERGPEKGKGVVARMMGRRPLEGGKSFTKQRVFPTFMDGIRAGFVPVDWNPVRLSLLKMAEQDRCITAWKLLESMHELKLPVFIGAGKRIPEGYSIPNDNAFKVYKSPLIDVKEAFDPKLMAGLEEVGKELGARIETKMKLGSTPAGVRWGAAAKSGESVARRFGGPEEVLAHELGHTMNTKINLLERLREGAPDAVDRELGRLADLRMEGREENATDEYRRYINSPDERVANLIHAALNIPDVVKEYAPQTWRRLQKIAEDEPAVKKLLDVQRSVLVEERTGKVSAGGIVQTGSYALPTPIADVLNTHLTPSLLSGSKAFQGYRKASQALLMARLGWSGFHLGFTTSDATLSRIALAGTYASRGDVHGAMKSLASVPKVFSGWFKDNPALKEWYAPGTQGEDMGAIIKALEMGGARARQGGLYELGAWEGFFRDLRQKGVAAEGTKLERAGSFLSHPGAVTGEIAKHPAKSFAALVEAGSRYILHDIVPRQKFAIAAQMAERELRTMMKETGEDTMKAALEAADPQRVKDVMARVWDSVDNRMGQVVYDNLFVNRTLRDALHASVQSVGWNLGTMRELGGGVHDVKNLFKPETDVRGKALPRLSDRLSYAAALPFFHALLSSAIQYAYTGEGPQEPKDLVFPRNGRTNPDGTPQRLAPATYMKDVAAYLGGFLGANGGIERGISQAASTVQHKMNPMLSMLAELKNNEDFYGTEIRHRDDPLAAQLVDVAKFIARGFLPYSYQGFKKERKSGASVLESLPALVGVPPAAASVSRSPLMQELITYQRDHASKAPRTKEQAEKSDIRKDLKSAFRRHDEDAIHEAEQRAREGGFFTPKELGRLGKNAKNDSMVMGFKGLPLPDAIRIYRLGSTEERNALASVMRHKIANKSGLDAVPLQKRVEYLREARGLVEASR